MGATYEMELNEKSGTWDGFIINTITYEIVAVAISVDKNKVLDELTDKLMELWRV